MENWVYKWENESWATIDGTRKNSDLWKQILIEIRKFPINSVVFKWCKGHTKDNEFNILADKLAGIGAKCEVLIDDAEIIDNL